MDGISFLPELTKEVHQMIKIRSLSPKIRAQLSAMVIGWATCPHCNRDDVNVVNDDGPKGNPNFHYFENHSPQGSDILCDGSEELLSKL
ncbi:MAG: hypothetical protein NUV60_00285 [Patescibacteria group bacterium]|nr:hypothetical protein [Patescibacteria group bacterium]